MHFLDKFDFQELSRKLYNIYVRKVNWILRAGKQILIELGKKGLRGYYFDSSQYHELKKIDKFDDAKAKIIEYGYQSVMEAENPKEIASLQKIISNTA